MCCFEQVIRKQAAEVALPHWKSIDVGRRGKISTPPWAVRFTSSGRVFAILFFVTWTGVVVEIQTKYTKIGESYRP